MKKLLIAIVDDDKPENNLPKGTNYCYVNITRPEYIEDMLILVKRKIYQLMGDPEMKKEAFKIEDIRVKAEDQKWKRL